MKFGDLGNHGDEGFTEILGVLFVELLGFILCAGIEWNCGVRGVQCEYSLASRPFSRLSCFHRNRGKRVWILIYSFTT